MVDGRSPGVGTLYGLKLTELADGADGVEDDVRSQDSSADARLMSKVECQQFQMSFGTTLIDLSSRVLDLGSPECRARYHSSRTA